MINHPIFTIKKYKKLVEEAYEIIRGVNYIASNLSKEASKEKGFDGNIYGDSSLLNSIKSSTDANSINKKNISDNIEFREYCNLISMEIKKILEKLNGFKDVKPALTRNILKDLELLQSRLIQYYRRNKNRNFNSSIDNFGRYISDKKISFRNYLAEISADDESIENTYLSDKESMLFIIRYNEIEFPATLAWMSKELHEWNRVYRDFGRLTQDADEVKIYGIERGSLLLLLGVKVAIGYAVLMGIEKVLDITNKSLDILVKAKGLREIPGDEVNAVADQLESLAKINVDEKSAIVAKELLEKFNYAGEDIHEVEGHLKNGLKKILNHHLDKGDAHVYLTEENKNEILDLKVLADKVEEAYGVLELNQVKTEDRIETNYRNLIEEELG